MAVEIIMPKAGMDMEEGTIIQWLKQVGDQVEIGEGLLEIETDKVAMEVEAPVAGILLCQYFAEGDVVPVVTVIAYVGEPGESVPEKPQITRKKAVAQAAYTPEDVDKKTAVLNSTKPIKATPYAKHIAKKNRINLRDVSPSGTVGEIKSRDVNKKIAEQESVLQEHIKVTALSGNKKVVAERMVKAHLEIPSVTQNTKVDMTNLLEIRKQINENSENKLTINDFIVRAVAKVLQDDKRMLVSLDNQEVVQHEAVNIGIVVALDHGLIVPVVKNAERKNLSEMSETIKELSNQAQAGSLSMAAIRGSTISISNLGMFGVYSFTPIINQPNAAIIGICSIEDELALIDGQVSNRKKMMISLTYDHRLINGKLAAQFSQKVAKLLENPAKILL